MGSARGYIMMEAVITCLILSFSIVALMPVFSLSAKSNLRTEQALVASHLAAALLEEIKLRKWDEATADRRSGRPIAAPSALGPDPGEPPNDKRAFNDVDDFDGWSEPVLMDPVMRPFPGFEGYERAVTVRYLDEDGDPTTRPTNMKRVVVCVRYKGSNRSCLERLHANL